MKKRLNSLSFQLPIIFIGSFILIAIFFLYAVYNRFENRMINDYTRMAEGVTNLMIAPLDTDKIDQYISENFSSQDYKDIVKYYHSLKDNYPDIYYMYVYRFDSADSPLATVVFDLDEEYSDNPPQESIDWIGDTYEVDEPFSSEINLLMTGDSSVIHTVHEIVEKDKEIQEISELTYKDALTGVGNRAAYLKDEELTDREIESGETSFAVIMTDINRLKYINDTFLDTRRATSILKAVQDLFKV